MRNISTGFGILAAPVVYLLGRFLGNPSVAARSIDMDVEYIRGYAQKMQIDRRNSEMHTRFLLAAKICAIAKRSVDVEMQRLFSRSHSQLLQDVVCALVHGEKRGGYFVEVGVGDGVRHSNTLMLERDFGWGGILAEPATMFHESIEANRKAVLDKRAVEEIGGRIVSFEQHDDDGEFSRISNGRQNSGLAVSSYNVETVRLDDLLSAHRAPTEIDFMSIDTEGSEISVLSGLSFDRWKFGLLSIEHNMYKSRLAVYDDMMSKNGYKRILPSISAFDAWFVHHDMNIDWI